MNDSLEDEHMIVVKINAEQLKAILDFEKRNISYEACQKFLKRLGYDKTEMEYIESDAGYEFPTIDEYSSDINEVTREEFIDLNKKYKLESETDDEFISRFKDEQSLYELSNGNFLYF